MDIENMTQNALDDLIHEIQKARAKFPSSELMMTALTEEVGEVAKALLDEPAENVYKEAIQVACCAIRLASEGDPTINGFRTKKGLDITP